MTLPFVLRSIKCWKRCIYYSAGSLIWWLWQVQFCDSYLYISETVLLNSRRVWCHGGMMHSQGQNEIFLHPIILKYNFFFVYNFVCIILRCMFALHTSLFQVCLYAVEYVGMENNCISELVNKPLNVHLHTSLCWFCLGRNWQFISEDDWQLLIDVFWSGNFISQLLNKCSHGNIPLTMLAVG